MSWLDGFRDPELAQKLIADIRLLAKPLSEERNQPLQIMEVCGGHTHTLFKYGIQDLFDQTIEFVHGPGCPVCVLPVEVIDDCFDLAMRSDVILTTFGDAMRVPGKRGSLLKAKAQGADIRMVYSPLDALKIALDNKDKEVIFLGLGFDTTMPSTAMTVIEAKRREIKNFSLYTAHITIIPTLKSLLQSGTVEVDGFIGPGHVSMIIGTEPYNFIPEEYGLPFVVSGFEPIDILESIYLLVRQLSKHNPKVENQYHRTVLPSGNPKAIQALAEVFVPASGFDWRGLGKVDNSGVRLSEAFEAFDCQTKFSVSRNKTTDGTLTELGLCSEVITGAKKPVQCPMFNNGCTPQTPIGALMVSNEGACAAYYQYSRDAIITTAG